MAGKKDRDDKLASYLTPFTKNQEVVADEVHSEDLPIIDLVPSCSALTNTIVVIPNQVSGDAAVCTIQLWRRVAGYPTPTGTWKLLETRTAVAPDTELRFVNLMAAEYQLVMTSVGSAVWDIYEAHTETR